MAHPAQRAFFEDVRAKYPESFVGKTVLECGSLDINGSLRDLFRGCFYLGIDIHPGPCVDVVWPACRVPFTDAFDTAISSEMLEHSETWGADLEAMYRACRPGGLIAVSCAGPGREEHGTARTGHVWGTSPDYYRNLAAADLMSALPADLFWASYYHTDYAVHDTYFYGIKKA